MSLCSKCRSVAAFEESKGGIDPEQSCDCKTAAPASRGGVTTEGSDDHSSVEAFVEFCLADESYTFTFDDVAEIAMQAQKSKSVVIRELKDYGLAYAGRPAVREVRGFTANPHNRWHNSGMHGGSGHEQISGFAGRKG
jgi:hypothetical protein